MRRALPLLALFLIHFQTQFVVAQERFDSGPYKGFLRSSIEHIIVEIRDPFEMKIIHGVVSDVTGKPLPDVNFEIRDSFGTVRGSKTDRLGRFKILGTPRGDYNFKITRDGFQSIVGKIIVSKKPHNKSSIRLAMSVGV